MPEHLGQCKNDHFDIKICPVHYKGIVRVWHYVSGGYKGINNSFSFISLRASTKILYGSSSVIIENDFDLIFIENSFKSYDCTLG